MGNVGESSPQGHTKKEKLTMGELFLFLSLGKLLHFLSNGSVQVISQKLPANAVSPVTLARDAKFIINLEPLKGYKAAVQEVLQSIKI